MKKHIATLLILFISFSAFAQLEKEKGYPKKISEKLKALKIAHITEQLDLTSEEAKVFWPIYNKHEDDLQELRDNLVRRKLEGLTKLSEDEAKQVLKDMIKLEKQKHELESQFLSDLSKVIPATKVLKLVRAERSFKRKMIEEFKGRRKPPRKN